MHQALKKSKLVERGVAKNTSPIWRGIEKAREIIKKGACYIVGNGLSISVWDDPWVLWLANFRPKPKDNLVSLQPMVVQSRSI